MASGTTRAVGCSSDEAWLRALCPTALWLLLALAACSPVETWRNLSGASRHDPNPTTTPNSQNLAAGAALPYPNLATVPPPPTQELTEVELKRLTQSLVADRVHAKYASEQLRAGLQEPESAPQPPALPPRSASTGVAPAAAPPGPRVPSTPERAAPISRDTAPHLGGSSTAGVAKSENPAIPGAATGMASGLRRPGQPPQPGPMESSLISPQIPETPQPERPEPAPPPPHLVAPATSGGSAHLPPAPVPMPATIPTFQPPPPRPTLAPPEPARTAMTAPAGKEPAPRAAAAVPVAEITFAAGSRSLTGNDRAALAKAVALYRENPGALRVVGYADVGPGAGDPLSTFRSALDQAQAVAAALTKAGIPAGKIAVEASPAKAAGGGDHAEVLLVH